jgi:hypothetical protein
VQREGGEHDETCDGNSRTDDVQQFDGGDTQIEQRPINFPVAGDHRRRAIDRQIRSAPLR